MSTDKFRIDGFTGRPAQCLSITEIASPSVSAAAPALEDRWCRHD